MAILLKTASVWVSSIQIMQVRVRNKGKRVWESGYVGDVSATEKKLALEEKRALIQEKKAIIKEKKAGHE